MVSRAPVIRCSAWLTFPASFGFTAGAHRGFRLLDLHTYHVCGRSSCCLTLKAEKTWGVIRSARVCFIHLSWFMRCFLPSQMYVGGEKLIWRQTLVKYTRTHTHRDLNRQGLQLAAPVKQPRCCSHARPASRQFSLWLALATTIDRIVCSSTTVD